MSPYSLTNWQECRKSNWECTLVSLNRDLHPKLIEFWKNYSKTDFWMDRYFTKVWITVHVNFILKMFCCLSAQNIFKQFFFNFYNPKHLNISIFPYLHRHWSFIQKIQTKETGNMVKRTATDGHSQTRYQHGWNIKNQRIANCLKDPNHEKRWQNVSKNQPRECKISPDHEIAKSQITQPRDWRNCKMSQRNQPRDCKMFHRVQSINQSGDCKMQSRDSKMA